MSYSEILETSDDGQYRVRLELDEYPDEPYDDGQSPLLRLDRGGYGVKAGHIMATGRPTGDDYRIEDAVRHWDTTPSDDDFGRYFEKYLRAYYGTTQIETWNSGNYWYVTYDTARWREYIGVPAGETAAVNMDEYRAWCEGDCWSWVTEKRTWWTTGDPVFPDREAWEAVDSCGGYYGSDYAGKCAREALADLLASAPEAAPAAKTPRRTILRRIRAAIANARARARKGK